jgi:ribosomal RNA-processing protein 9
MSEHISSDNEEEREYGDEGRENGAAEYASGSEAGSGEEDETAGERRLRLAKALVAQYEAAVEAEEDDTTDYAHAVAQRLRADMHEQRGTLQRRVAEALAGRRVDEARTRVLRGHRLPVTCVVLSTEARSVVTGSKDGSIIKWDRATGVKEHHWHPQGTKAKPGQEVRAQMGV